MEVINIDESDSIKFKNQILDTISYIIIYINKDYKILWTNRKANEYFGLNKNEIKGKKCYQIIKNKDNICDECVLKKVIRTGHSQFIKEKVHEDEIFLKEIKLVTDNDLDGILIVLKDITEEYKREEKKDFLHSLLRHDLKNKLQIIEGYIQLLKESNNFNKEQNKFINRAMRSVKDGVDLIDKIKTLLKVEKAPKKRVNILTYISNTVSQLKYKLEENDIKIDIDIEECYIEGGELLEEVFYNLINNSIKHANCDLIKLYINKQDEKCTLIFEDNGRGIPDEEKEKVFKEGFKKGINAGSGLGLYLVREIIENYNGKIELMNSELGGARFEIILNKIS